MRMYTPRSWKMSSWEKDPKNRRKEGSDEKVIDIVEVIIFLRMVAAAQGSQQSDSEWGTMNEWSSLIQTHFGIQSISELYSNQSSACAKRRKKEWCKHRTGGLGCIQDGQFCISWPVTFILQCWLKYWVAIGKGSTQFANKSEVQHGPNTKLKTSLTFLTSSIQ